MPESILSIDDATRIYVQSYPGAEFFGHLVAPLVEDGTRTTRS